MYELSNWLPLQIERDGLTLFYLGAQVNNSHEPAQPPDVPNANGDRWRAYVAIAYGEQKQGLSLSMEVNGGGDNLKEAYNDAVERMKADGWTWASHETN